MSAELLHGHTRYGGRKAMSPTYTTWTCMRRRCNDPLNEDYGMKGITYDPRWDDFMTFLQDVGERPDGMTLDRIDCTGNYSKENCRWADLHTQLHNRRNTAKTTFQGVEIPLRDLSNLTGIPYQTLWARINKQGWSGDKAGSTPVNILRTRKATR